MLSVFELPLWDYSQQQKPCVATQIFFCKLQTAPYNYQYANANANALQLHDYWELRAGGRKRKAESGEITDNGIHKSSGDLPESQVSYSTLPWGIRTSLSVCSSARLSVCVCRTRIERFFNWIYPLTSTHFNNSLFGHIIQTYLTLSSIEKISSTGNTMVKLLSATTLLALLSFGYVKWTTSLCRLYFLVAGAREKPN